MNNGKHVVNHLFFRRKFDLVDDNELAVMLVTNVTNEFEAEAHQSILMGNDQTANFTTANSVYRKLFKNPCSQAELNKIVPFGFSLQRQKMVFFCH